MGILLIVAFGIFIDLAFNSGIAIATIIHGHPVETGVIEPTDRLQMISEVIEELDGLQDELSYALTTEQEAIKEKIAARNKVLDALLTKEKE